ncbi:toll/interleukin-1 receptor domain-containing protein [Methyloprofundus sedimenti]|nr:toll/interleukin-1 receptor domain-containing protein [Methyloprofundus sedimenti]
MKIFWSYAKLDDQKPYKLTTLREAFKIILDETIGFETKIVVDVHDLKWGDDWYEKLDHLVSDADLFLPIMSPSYFNSKMCMRELNWAISKKTIIPIYYRDCPKGMHCSFKENNAENKDLNKMSAKITTFQYKDFRYLRNKGVSSELVQDFLDKISIDIDRI